MNPDEFIGIPVRHPLRYRRELIPSDRNPQQRQDVRMVESLPYCDRLVEPLWDVISSPQNTASWTHLFGLLQEVAPWILQDLYRNLLSIVTALPYYRVPAIILHGPRQVITKWIWE